MPPVAEEEELRSQVKEALQGEDLPKRIKKLNQKQIRKLTRAILIFSENLANLEMYPYQREFASRCILSVLTSDAENMTGLFARQSGKSTTLAVIINGMMVMLPLLTEFIDDARIQKFKNGFWVGIYAPSHEQASLLFSKILMYLHSEHAAEILRDDEIGIEMDSVKGNRAQLPNGSYARSHSAAIQAKIEGATWHLIVIEEAQDVNPYVYKKSISPMGASTAASTIKIGTCNTVRSDFYDNCQRNVRRDMAQQDHALKLHFQYDYEVVTRYNQWYRIYVQKEISQLGFDSDEFRMAYRLHWILERGMLVDPALFALMGKNYSPFTYDPVHEIVAGIDIGKAEASTVVTLIIPDYGKGARMGPDDFRSFKKVINWLEIRGDDYVAQMAQIRDFFSNYRRLKRVMIDATGVGQPLYDWLCNYFAQQIEEGTMEIIPFIATSESNHEGYLRLMGDLQNERLEYPNSERARKNQRQRNFVQQVTNLQKIYRGAYLTVEAGEEVPQKDFGSSLMLACYACDYVSDENREVEVVSNFLVDAADRRSRGLGSDRSGRALHRM
jgi:hypothetical protein